LNYKFENSGQHHIIILSICHEQTKTHGVVSLITPHWILQNKFRKFHLPCHIYFDKKLKTLHNLKLYLFERTSSSKVDSFANTSDFSTYIWAGICYKLQWSIEIFLCGCRTAPSQIIKDWENRLKKNWVELSLEQIL